MKNKIQKENDSSDLPNYEPLRNELSKILENQIISKNKRDQILKTTQKGSKRFSIYFFNERTRFLSFHS